MSDKPALELISAHKADRRGFARLADRVRLDNVRIVLSRNGVPVAAIISVEDLKKFERLEESLANHSRDENQTAQLEVP